jgi:hypothetical protein
MEVADMSINRLIGRHCKPEVSKCCLKVPLMDIETQVLKGLHLEVKKYHNLELPINSHPDSLMIK